MNQEEVSTSLNSILGHAEELSSMRHVKSTESTDELQSCHEELSEYSTTESPQPIATDPDADQSIDVNTKPQLLEISQLEDQTVTEEAVRGEQNNAQLQQNTTRPDFCMGDHIYYWNIKLSANPIQQHHAIVVDVIRNDNNNNTTATTQDDDTTIASKDDGSNKIPEYTLVIADWQNDRFALRHITNHDDWHKVQYNAKSSSHYTKWSGTCTTASRSPRGLVRARVEFAIYYTSTCSYINDKSDYTSEAWAVWCSTGTWATLQMTSWLWMLAAGQVKSTATLAGMAATATVTVPSAGMWGWLGYTTQVGWLATQPWWIPVALAGYGIVTVGIPAVLLKRHASVAKSKTNELNTAFGEYALVNADQYANKLIEWSGIVEDDT